MNCRLVCKSKVLCAVKYNNFYILDGPDEENVEEDEEQEGEEGSRDALSSHSSQGQASAHKENISWKFTCEISMFNFN